MTAGYGASVSFGGPNFLLLKSDDTPLQSGPLTTSEASLFVSLPCSFFANKCASIHLLTLYCLNYLSFQRFCCHSFDIVLYTCHGSTQPKDSVGFACHSTARMHYIFRFVCFYNFFYSFLNNKIIKSSVRIAELGGTSNGHKCLSLVSITFCVRFRWRRYNAGDSGLCIRDSWWQVYYCFDGIIFSMHNHNHFNHWWNLYFLDRFKGFVAHWVRCWFWYIMVEFCSDSSSQAFSIISVKSKSTSCCQLSS